MSLLFLSPRPSREERERVEEMFPPVYDNGVTTEREIESQNVGSIWICFLLFFFLPLNLKLSLSLTHTYIHQIIYNVDAVEVF